jgi:uncharacterized integral membrane protein
MAFRPSERPEETQMVPQQPAPQAPSRQAGSVPTRQVVAAVLVALAAVVIAQNRTQTSVQVLFVDVTLPLWLLLTVTGLLGVLVGLLLARRRARARRRR